MHAETRAAGSDSRSNSPSVELLLALLKNGSVGSLVRHFHVGASGRDFRRRNQAWSKIFKACLLQLTGLQTLEFLLEKNC